MEASILPAVQNDLRALIDPQPQYPIPFHSQLQSNSQRPRLKSLYSFADYHKNNTSPPPPSIASHTCPDLFIRKKQDARLQEDFYRRRPDPLLLAGNSGSACAGSHLTQLGGVLRLLFAGIFRSPINAPDVYCIVSEREAR